MFGCGSSKGIEVLNKPFEAMPARLGVINNQWEVIFAAPTGGWQARYDTDEPMFDGREVYITLTEPDPDAFVTQAITELHVLTPIAVETTINVYARVVPFVIKDGKKPTLFHSGTKEPNPPYTFAAAEYARPHPE